MQTNIAVVTMRRRAEPHAPVASLSIPRFLRCMALVMPRKFSKRVDLSRLHIVQDAGWIERPIVSVILHPRSRGTLSSIAIFICALTHTHPHIVLSCTERSVLQEFCRK